MSRRPDVSVKVILRARGKVLMLRRDDGTHDFPGGRLEWGESPEQAAKRELLEELNYTLPATPQFLDIYNYISKDSSRHSVFLHYFLSLDGTPDLQTTEEESDAEVVWLSKDEMCIVVSDPAFINRIYSASLT